LIAALLISSEAPAQPAVADAAAQRPVTPQASAVPAQTNDVARADEVGAARAEKPNTEKPSAAKPSVDEPSADDRSAAGASDAARERGDVAPERRRFGEPEAQRRPRRLALEVVATGLMVAGALPVARPGLGLRTTGAFPLREPLALGIELGARAALPHLERSEQGRAHFSWWSGVLALCARLQARSRAIATSGCAVGEFGQLLAAGSDTESPKRVRTLWSALGPGARVAWHFASPWSLLTAAELLVPLARDRFELGSVPLWQVAPLTFRAELGFGVHLP
jgi:hypothetical protein